MLDPTSRSCGKRTLTHNEREATHQPVLNSWVIPLLLLRCYWDILYKYIIIYFTKSNINTLVFSLVYLSYLRCSELTGSFLFWGGKHVVFCMWNTLFLPSHPTPNLSLLIDRATPMDFRRLPGEAWSIVWVWCSSRAMESFRLPMPSGTYLWPQQLLFITMPFGSTFTEVLQT